MRKRYFVIPILLGALIWFYSGGDEYPHLSPPLHYRDDERVALTRLHGLSQEELDQEMYEQGNAAALFDAALKALAEGEKAKHKKLDEAAVHRMAAAASLGYQPAIILLSYTYYLEKRPWPSLVLLQAAADVGHDEVRHAMHHDYMTYEKHAKREVRRTVKREVNRIKNIIEDIQTQFAQIDNPQDRRDFITWLIREGGLIKERDLAFQPQPGDDVIDPVPIWTKTPDGWIPDETCPYSTFYKGPTGAAK
jgi:hypothetical protein